MLDVTQEIVSGWNLFEFWVGRVLCFCPRECYKFKSEKVTRPRVFVSRITKNKF